VSNRCRVLKVVEDVSNITQDRNNRKFTISAMVMGKIKDLVFECKDKGSKDAWIKACNSGLRRIEEEHRYMTDEFSVQIEFSKKKLGFRVREKVLEEKRDAEAVCETSEKKDEVVSPEAGVKSFDEANVSAESEEKMVMEQVQIISAHDTMKETVRTDELESSGVQEKTKSCLTPTVVDSVQVASKIDEKPHSEPDVQAKEETTEVFEQSGDKAIMEQVETEKNNDIEKVLVDIDNHGQSSQEPSAENDKIEDLETVGDKKYERPCELVVTEIHDRNLLFHGLVENAKVIKINDITLQGLSYSEQVNILLTTERPVKLTFTGENYLKSSSVNTTAYCSILKELVANEKNDVQSVFNELVKGTAFAKELESSGDDCTTTIKALLSNRARLITLLQNFRVHED